MGEGRREGWGGDLWEQCGEDSWGMGRRDLGGEGSEWEG